MGKLDGRTAIVTGASRGIGDEIARLFAREGAHVVCAARTLNEGDHLLSGSLSGTVGKIKQAGGEAIAVAVDVSKEEDCQRLVKTAQEAFGTVDVLVNDAALTYYKPIVDYNVKHWAKAFAVNVHGPFMLSQLVLPGMIKVGRGAIVNISSGSAIGPGRAPFAGARPATGGTMYGATKAALERFTQGLAQGGRGAGHCRHRPLPLADRGYPRHRLPPAHEEYGRPERRAARIHGARGATAGERTGGEGQRPRHLQPTDTGRARPNRQANRPRRDDQGLGVFPNLNVAVRPT
jgi:NAD(P)-dependent dehydrogenase (short-subunit alcohol dehydrogenase family)